MSRPSLRCASCRWPLDLEGLPEVPEVAEPLPGGATPFETRPEAGQAQEPSDSATASSEALPRLGDSSFIVLPGDALASRAAPPAAESNGVGARLAAAQRALDLAAAASGLDQPLCRDCASSGLRELQAQAAQASADAAAYAALLTELQAEEAFAPTAAAAERELRELEAAVTAEEAAAAAAEAQAAAAAIALAAARADAARLDAEEAAVEREAELVASAAAAAADEAAALDVRVAGAAAQLEVLRRMHVMNEAFHIWQDGPFATISGFRLGRTSALPVEWEEINAAWGQAVLLLTTMAATARLAFASHALLPCGSTPRVRDTVRGGTYDLFGPVNPLNLLAAQRYDRAQCGFVACLAEFAVFAAGRDLAAGVHPPFELPYPLDGDKVDGRSVRFTLSRDDKWTAALKLLLTDVKVLLSWVSARYLTGPG